MQKATQICKFLFLVSLVILSFFSISVKSFAGCERVYFKPFSKQVFSDQVSFLPFTEPKDITGDGNLDLLGFTNIPNSAVINKLYIYPGTGSGEFSAPIILNLPTFIVNNIIISDFNNDNKNDIVVLLVSNPKSALIYQNDGNGNFNPLTPSPLANNSEILLNLVDINNDGIGDLFTINGTSYFYRFGNADGTFGIPVQISKAVYSQPADFDGNGKIDFPVIMGTSQNAVIGFYLNQGNGVFFLDETTVNLNGPLTRLYVRDLNNDGKPDLIGYSDTTVFVIKNLGNKNFSKSEYEIPSEMRQSIYKPTANTGDFNGDGFVEFIVTQHTPPSYLIFTNDGTGNFTQRFYPRKANGKIFGDFDNDNKTDYVEFKSLTFQNIKSGNSIFPEPQITVSKNVCSTYGQTKIVDFNGDSLTDRVFWRESDGRWRYKLAVFPFSEVIINWGLSGDIPVLGDYDGDGKTDIAVYRPSNGVWYILNSSDGSFTFTRFGISEDKPVASDFDGDGKTDIAVYRPSTRVWYILNSSDHHVQITRFGLSEDKPVPEDYDGDGKTDIAVYRPSTGVWYILRSSDGNFSALGWGVASDIPTPADFDGDGKADFSVYRPSEGLWYILRSNNFHYIAYRFGISEDIPQVGDWNGNGIVDLGVYRPSSGNWYSSDTTFQYSYPAAGEISLSSIIKNQ